MGTVKNITEYGAFVDLGGLDGLLHITDISWGRINHPSEALNVGDEIKVQVEDAIRQLLDAKVRPIECLAVARYALAARAARAGSIDNSGSPAAFSINATATIAGMFMVTNSTKSGTSGTLYSEGNFTQGNRSVVSGDTLNCTATETAS